ncbi:uncharacterized protein LOC110834342 isoform X1 [Zootermopsis nevadensis]|nr:uncharacterized protein LOC110834342 isoform X1 [Zootermopsis nevadensis]
MLSTVCSLMYVPVVVAVVVVTGRKEVNTSLFSSENTTLIHESQAEEVMNCELFYEGSSSYLNSTQQRHSQINNASEFRRNCESDNEEDKNDHVKGSQSVTESTNITHKISPQQSKPSVNIHQFRNTSTNFKMPLNTRQDMNTKFSNEHEHTRNGTVFTQQKDQLDRVPEYHDELSSDIRNNSHQTNTNKNTSVTPESNSENRKNSAQGILKPLIEEDVQLNRSLAEAWNYTEQFLNSGDLNIGQKAIHLTKNYVTRRRVWISYMQLFSSNNKNLSDVLLSDGTSLQARISESNELESALSKLQNIHRLATVVKVEEKNIRTYFDTHNYSASLSSVLETEAYLNDWEVAVHDMKDISVHFSLNNYFTFPLNNSFHVVSERKVYLETMNESIHKDYVSAIKKQELKMIFQYYVYPTVYLVILVLGVVGNGVLIFVFAKHKKIRTTPNIMIFNLALVDVVNLFINSPLYYISKYHSQWMYLGGYGCRVFATFRFLNHTIIELSIVALSVQRYCAVASTMRKARTRQRLSARARTLTFILTVWLIALVFSLPPSIVFEYPNGVCFPLVKSQIVVKVLDIFYFVFFCFVLPISMAVFSVMTARKLRQSVLNIPGELRYKTQEITRYRSAKVVTALAITYAISHIPRSIWFFLVSFYHLDRHEMKFMCIDEVTNYLILSNSCLNPFALYIASRNFRRLFNRHLFCIQENNQQARPQHRQVTASNSSTRLIFFIDSDTEDMTSSKDSFHRLNIPKKQSEVVSVNPSV